MHSKIRALVAVFISGLLLSSQKLGAQQNPSGPGSVDLTFTGHTNAIYAVRALLLHSDGSLLVSRHESANTPFDDTILLLTNDVRELGFYTTRHAAGGFPATDLLELPDGDILAAGALNGQLSGGTVQLFGFYRFAPRGPNSSFLPNYVFSPSISDPSDPHPLVLQNDHKIIGSIGSVTYNGYTKFGLVRCGTNGAIDTGFHFGGSGVDTNGYVSALSLQGDGKILVGGTFTNLNGAVRTNLGRLNADGSLDSGFNVNLVGFGGNAGVKVIAPSPSGKILIGGQQFIYSAGADSRTNIIRLNADGTFDSSFNATIGGSIRKIIVQPDEKILIAGKFETVNGVSRRGVARLNSDGSLDATFDVGTGVGPASTDPLGSVSAMIQLRDGKLLVGGNFDSFNGVQHRNLARLNGGGGPLVSQSTNAGTVTFSVAATGAELSYQWQLNGTNLPGATAATYTVSNTGPARAGRYSVVVGTSTGLVVSQPAVLRSFGDLRMFAGMSIAGEFGDRYRIEAADIVPGVTNWVTVTDFTHPGGVFLYTDANSPGRPQRYYRAVLLP